MRKLLFFISIFITVSAFSFNLGGSVDSYFLTGSNYQDITFSIDHEGNNFNFFADLKAINDGKYKPSHPSVYYGNFYFFMKDGGMSLYNDFFRLNTGRINKKDPADSPYSLFLSSKENSAVSLDFSYEDDTFLYNTTYMELNKDSVLGYPDRGANYKHYGIKFGNLRVMYQESVVYVGEAFDTEYFINPIPTFFIQYVNSSSGKPWTHGSNANAIMGFLSDYKTENMYIYGQILVDDFNMNRFLLPEGSQNPDKLAVSSGFKIRNGNGFLGIYGAAATKYTFEPYGGYG
ncbi:MAG TPA: hypothetical protein PLS66_10255, partial [Tepiditoga sp.]|nr:hypothetical protein [Tepiditoga sp.]